MFQEIIVALIGLSVLLTVGYKIYGFFFSKRGTSGSCGCSGGGCGGAKRKQINS